MSTTAQYIWSRYDGCGAEQEMYIYSENQSRGGEFVSECRRVRGEMGTCRPLSLIPWERRDTAKKDVEG